MTTHYVYGAGGLLYGEYDNTGAMVREYIYLNGAPLAQITAGSPETVAYLHTDHLGTPRYATNSGGTQVWSWNNDAFGTSTPSGSATVNLRMPGQYYDSESGLFYNWNRYYNPAIGRYISSDPSGLGGGLNTFGYADQNPVMRIDPTGKIAESVILPCLIASTVLMYIIIEERIKCIQDPNSICNERFLNETPELPTSPEVPEIPDKIIGDNPKETKPRTNTDLPGDKFPETVKDLTGGALTPDTNNPGHQVAPNGVRLRPPEEGVGPRIDIPAKGDKPRETIHFPPDTKWPY